MKTIIIIKALVDLILVHLGYITAFLVRYGRLPEYNMAAYLSVAPWLTIAVFLIFFGYGFYSTASFRWRWDEVFSATVSALAILFVIAFALPYLLYEFAFPRLTIFIAFFYHIIYFMLWRYILLLWTRKYIGPMKILVVGLGDDAWKRAKSLQAEQMDTYNIVALLVDQISEKRKEKAPFPVIEQLEAFTSTLEEYRPNSILICPGIPENYRLKLIIESTARGIQVFLIPNLYEILITQSHLEQINSFPTFRLTRFASGRQIWKRLMDLFLAVVFSVPSLVLIFLAAVALKSESFRAPIFYAQERVSRHGHVFKLLKLRTMIPDAEKDTGPVLSDIDDSRVTAIGRILRLTRIDELPQLWNVLKGEMSFVGPRAERPVFIEQHSREIPGYDYRHIISSGITGLAQVQGRYSTTTEDKLRYDLVYLQTFSPLRDLHILMHTLKVMLMKDKAI